MKLKTFCKYVIWILERKRFLRDLVDLIKAAFLLDFFTLLFLARRDFRRLLDLGRITALGVSFLLNKSIPKMTDRHPMVRLMVFSVILILMIDSRIVEKNAFHFDFLIDLVYGYDCD
ncbi:hypothetical protein T06_3519 [Trichinella sp. T6]|nr:hypothetical protein T06_3519 [Trichinella sp. T6]